MYSLHLEDQLCFKLYALSRQITQLYQPALESLGITYPQYLVMLALWQTPTLSVKDLGERLYLDSGTLTPLLKRMEQKSLVTRRRDPEDERSVLIGLTDKGKKMRLKAQCMPEELEKTFGKDESAFRQVRGTLDQLLTQTQ